MEPLDQVDYELLDRIAELMPITISELSRATGWSKSMVDKRVRKLLRHGLVEVRVQGRVSIITAREEKNPAVTIGILRASEYPYIIKFVKLLKGVYEHVNIKVYDDAFKEAMDLSTGRIKLAMAPAISLLIMNRMSRGRVFIIGGGSGHGSGIVTNPGGAGGHTTSMMSSMELCAEISRLEMPRVYSRSGWEMMEKIERGLVKHAVLWEPYLTFAKKRNYSVEGCELEVCCLLGAHSSLREDFGKIRKLFSSSVSAVKGADIEGYSRIIGMPTNLVKESVMSYTFFEEPDKNYLKRVLDSMRKISLPGTIVSDAIM